MGSFTHSESGDDKKESIIQHVYQYLLQSRTFFISGTIFTTLLLVMHVTPLLCSPPIGQSYFGVLVPDVVGVVLVDVEAAVVGAGVGGVGIQALVT